MPSRLAGLLVVLAFAALAPSAHAAPLRAGVATADITPQNGGTTLGFVRPDVMVRGVHTRLMGRALVLDDGDTKVALLSTDLAYPLEKDSLVARVADLGYTHESILYTGTHTHSGPGSLSDWQVEQLAQAIRAADARLEPARAAWGTANVLDVNRNRSIEAHLANHGLDQFYGQGHPEDDPDGADHTVDSRLRLLRVDRAAGGPLAGWIHFPVHLTTSAPDVDIWDTDLAGAATHHLETQVGAAGFTALYTNGALGDLMPRFDAYSRTATMDLHGRRIAARALDAWQAAGARLQSDVTVGTRWTRSCYCGQEVEPGRRVSDTPLWGLSFFGGSEDGASIFHEPLATEGRRLPEDSAHPVHGRKIIVAQGLVHESVPEVHVVQVGDRLLLGAPGEPSVEMGRRFEEAVRPHLPAGVKEPVVVGLANDYMGYLTTHEEYDMQHYEGGHTVFGLWTSLVVRDALVALSGSLARGKDAPAPDEPATLGGTARGTQPAGDTQGALTQEPPETVSRFDSISIAWEGSANGVDRPVDEPFIALERFARGRWRMSDSDLGLAFIWREQGGGYTARYEVAGSQRTGRHRLRIRSTSYDLTTRPFKVKRSTGLKLRGVLRRRPGAVKRLIVVAQNPAPDPTRAILWRSTTPTGGQAVIRLRGRRMKARWWPRRQAWVARTRRRVPLRARATVLRARDEFGNRIPGRVRVRLGTLAPLEWPPNIGTGDGRTPGALGEGTFPP
ncbi:MAG TPA: neutral/alkaline non-lysosomal ceramidase N-terminal domain-containing protein [Thermoleophilaceae bacterium]|nr:neutral/alkaline non-lysosomal ceramidase N-terminal domain-containing protein [Thermoleophilaceae bacterium]